MKKAPDTKCLALFIAGLWTIYGATAVGVVVSVTKGVPDGRGVSMGVPSATGVPVVSGVAEGVPLGSGVADAPATGVPVAVGVPETMGVDATAGVGVTVTVGVTVAVTIGVPLAVGLGVGAGIPDEVLVPVPLNVEPTPPVVPPEHPATRRGASASKKVKPQERVEAFNIN